MTFQQRVLEENVSRQNTLSNVRSSSKGTPPFVAAKQNRYSQNQASLQYQPLSIHEPEIRLLCLHADSLNTGILVDSDGRDVVASSSLVTASLNDTVEYFALSYPWGSGEERDCIVVDGFSQRIRRSLAATIRYINARRKGRPIHLWIDKLCIKQTDLDEKAWQIHHMSKKIYSRASKTLVWLGIDDALDGSTFHALSSLEDLTQRGFLDEMRQLEQEHVESQQGIYIDPDCLLPTDDAVSPLSSKWAHLRSVFSLPWWGRRWVIQEAFFSKVPIVCLGTSCNYDAISHDFAGIHMDKLAQVAVWHASYMSKNNHGRPHEIIKTLFAKRSNITH